MEDIRNPKNSEGRYKDYKIVIVYDYWEDEDLYEDSDVWGYFNSIKEIKEYLTDEVKAEIKEYYESFESYEVAVCSVNRPFPDEYNLKKMSDTSEKEEEMIFCPYCGKWRLFYETEEYDNVCIACGVSEKNYDVEKYKYMK